jgi:hypothetical protein
MFELTLSIGDIAVLSAINLAIGYIWNARLWSNVWHRFRKSMDY